MMKKISIFFLVIGLLCGSSGCSSVLLPYHENFLCERGKTGGYCGSLREVYEVIKYQEKNNKGGSGPCVCTK